MSVGGGGSKPKEIKATESEKQQAGLARDQINYYRSTFAPLEGEFAKMVDQDPSARLQGQNATASAREMTGTLQGAAMNGGVVNTAEIAEGRTLGRVGGMGQGARELADGRLDALGVGLGITADATRSLGQAGQMQTDAAIEKTKLSLAKQQAKNDEKAALMGAVGSLGGMYAGYKLPGMMGQPKGMTMAQAGEAYQGVRPSPQSFKQRNTLING
jgi:hypothetical protein